MHPIPRSTVEHLWETHCGLDADETRRLIDQFMQEQPFLAAYIMAGDSELGEAAPQSNFIPLATLVWDAFRAAGRKRRMIAGERIELVEERNIKMLTDLDAGSELQYMDSVRKTFDSYRQKELLGFILEVLMSGNEESPELAHDSIGLELLWLKTIIDCLDR